MSKMSGNYLGKAGQLFAMSEFLMLGWNVAIPEVDRGDDIFVVKDENGELRRVQVKTAKAVETAKGHVAQFNVPFRQLITPINPEIHFLFLIRGHKHWIKLILIRRDDLVDELYERLQKPDYKPITINLRILLNVNEIRCGKTDFSRYTELTRLFPVIQH